MSFAYRGLWELREDAAFRIQLKLKEETVVFIVFFTLEELIAVVIDSSHSVAVTHASHQSFVLHTYMSTSVNICLKNFNHRLLKKYY